MENEEKNIGLIQDNNIDPYLSNIFKPNYENQKLDDNIDFQNWKSSMINKYGEKGKIYKCMKDKVLFYNSYEEGYRYNVNEGLCPLCKKRYCYFCSKMCSDYNCCLKKKLIDMYNEGKKFSNKQIGELGEYEFAAFECFLIPGFNIIFFIGIIFNISYYKLIKEFDKDYPYAYETFLHKNNLKFSIILVLNGITSIFFAIAFFIYGIVITIIFLLIIIFKKSIFIFLIGCCDEDFTYLYRNLHKVLKYIC